ncbi:MAG: hypothetical protein JRJ12_03350 [Deltaproteobacteria bacterium]|nr:hypothetical protein [Deltaproteobacteria bacterium]MBW2070265.1 hypothetical protein [Deltaproteobacteria bacterium]
MKTLVWWLLRSASALLSLFFLFFGIELCRAAFRLEQPHEFILTFFASSFIILISAVLLVGAAVRMINRLRQPQTPADFSRDDPPDSS